jgi:hypothetical protein
MFWTFPTPILNFQLPTVNSHLSVINCELAPEVLDFCRESRDDDLTRAREHG